MMLNRPTVVPLGFLPGLVALLALSGCGGAVEDEATRAHVDSFDAASEDFFSDMDYGVPLREDEVKGRNMWIVWTGGNDRFWDVMANGTFGAFDLLKTLSTHPKLYYGGDRMGGHDTAVRCLDVYPGADSYQGDAEDYVDESSGYYRSSYVAARRGKAEHNGRWCHLGLVNEPCFQAWEPPPDCDQALDPWGCGNPEYYGLWLDRRVVSPECPLYRDGEPVPLSDAAYESPLRPDLWKDPFADASRYPGVPLGARGSTVPRGSYYGEPSGIVGLRLFPNPDFDEKAKAAWDPYRYYNDPAYYQRKALVRPFRVGMSCGFCHVGPNPGNPPVNPESPRWENLSSNPGAQYFWVDRIFYWDNAYRDDPDVPTPNEGNFIFQLFQTNPPGSLDTSLVSTDNINNPRTMNAVYSVLSRLQPSLDYGRETLAGGGLENAQFHDFDVDPTKNTRGYYTENAPTDGRVGVDLDAFFRGPDVVYTPRVLKDGSDSVGVLGALNRVYLNIGLYSEEWLRHFTLLVGGQKITPIRIADAEKKSAYWRATVKQTPAMALFFLQTAQREHFDPDPVKNRRLVVEKLQVREGLLDEGKRVFGETCARCHSSKIPALPESVTRGCDGGGNGPEYLDCFRRYWIHTKTRAFKDAMVEMVREPDFLEGNFLSSERRIPVTLLQTNVCSALATNAIDGDIWDNFSSQSYKDLPPVGTVKLPVYNPITGEGKKAYRLRGGGRGYTRPASLVSVWSTAPFLQNNSVGKFYPDPDVESRLASFNDSIEKLLWPEKRSKDKTLGSEKGLDRGFIYRTSAPSCLKVPRGYLPWGALPALRLIAPQLVGEDGVEIGPIPKGTPVNLLANLEVVPEAGFWGSLVHRLRLAGLLLDVGHELKDINEEHGGACSEVALQDMDKQDAIRRRLADNAHLIDRLLAFSKCPDFVVNRGHYFGTDQLDEADFWKVFDEDQRLDYEASGGDQRPEREIPLTEREKRALIEYLKTM